MSGRVRCRGGHKRPCRISASLPPLPGPLQTPSHYTRLPAPTTVPRRGQGRAHSPYNPSEKGQECRSSYVPDHSHGTGVGRWEGGDSGDWRRNAHAVIKYRPCGGSHNILLSVWAFMAPAVLAAFSSEQTQPPPFEVHKIKVGLIALFIAQVSISSLFPVRRWRCLGHALLQLRELRAGHRRPQRLREQQSRPRWRRGS